MNGHIRKITLGLLLSSAASLTAMNAFATEGYFVHGSGTRNKAMAGAGVADGQSATALITNPAGIAGMDSQSEISISLFNPNRKFTGSGGPGFTPVGEFKSSETLFAIPTAAVVFKIDDTSSWGISVAANGGMNTNYRDVTNVACGQPGLPATSGVFCGGTTGINLNQMLISVGYAREIGNLKIGIAPIIALQSFEAIGLAAFGAPTTTVNGAALTNNGADWSTGIGGKIGVEYALTDQIRIGGVYQPKISMSEFDDYAGLFADGGDFDIPSNYQIGITADVSPTFTVSVDYRRINYSGIGSIGNSSRTPLPFGSINGPGFGWQSIDVIKGGVEWKANDQWKLRAGWAHNDQPISGDDVTLNLLAPGVVQDHFTFGGEYKMNDTHSFEFAGMYAPTEKVSGIEVAGGPPNPGRTIVIEMNQFEATFGWKMKFGQ